MAWIMGGFIALGLFVLFFLRSGSVGCKYTYVPAGEDWQRFYRAQRETKKKGVMSGRWFWVIVGSGIGVAVVAGILAAVT